MNINRIAGLGAILLSVSAVAHAQSGTATRDTYTTVNPYTGTVARTTVNRPYTPAGIGGIIANQSIYGSAYPGTTTNTTVYLGHGAPPVPYYPPTHYRYPAHPAPAYPVQTYSYPGPAVSGPIAPPSYSWEKPSWITSIPLGGSVTTYGSPYPTYPAQPYPGYTYSYPYPTTYPAPQPACPPLYAPGYNVNVYNNPAYGTVSTQSTQSGYGVQAGNNGVSVSLGQRSSSTTTTVTPLGGTASLTTSSTQTETNR